MRYYVILSCKTVISKHYDICIKHKGWWKQLHQLYRHPRGAIAISQASLVGRGGYRAPPGNILLIGIPRSEKIRSKRFTMITSQQNVPRIIVMQISAAIIEKSNLHYISTNIADN